MAPTSRIDRPTAVTGAPPLPLASRLTDGINTASKKTRYAQAVPGEAGPAGTKGLRRQVPRAEREEQMLAAATQLFAERGYANVPMDAIATQTGITKPLLYSYFGSKEGLYAACIRRFLD